MAGSSDKYYDKRQSIAGGDIGAFKKLFEDMYPSLYVLANKLTDDEELAKDIVAEVFLQVWQKKETLLEVDDLNAYLYVMTRNLAYQYHKKNQKLIEKTDDYQKQYEDGDDQNFLHTLYNTETIRVLRTYIDILPAECKKVVILGLEGKSNGEISSLLGISPSAVSNQKNRAIKILRKKLPPYLLSLLILSFNC